MRGLIWGLLFYSGAVALVRYFHRNTLTILLYHGVAPKVERDDIYNYRRKFIEPAHFQHQLRYFQKHYRILPLQEALENMKNGSLPPYSLAITFDDGYENNYHYAYPILHRLGIPATVFITTDFVRNKRPLWVDRLEYAIGGKPLTKADRIAEDSKLRDALKSVPNDEKEARLEEVEATVRALSDFNGERAVYAPLTTEQMEKMISERISIGAHTASHPILSRMESDAQREEISGSRLALEAAGFSVSKVFAYPNGQRADWNEASEKAALAAGFSHALSTVEGANTALTHPMRLYRSAMDGTSDDVAEFAAIAAGMRRYLSRIKQALS